ncbi:MAG: hypothetical protein KJ072_07425 [Verrucomicrobia bacterium]|nr:hypothetical protein [Verrucomicrobiota bacterium]
MIASRLTLVMAGALGGLGAQETVPGIRTPDIVPRTVMIGPGVPWIRHVIDATSTGADGVKLGDLDADGDLDVIACEESAGLGVIWYENPVRQ